MKDYSNLLPGLAAREVERKKNFLKRHANSWLGSSAKFFDLPIYGANKKATTISLETLVHLAHAKRAISNFVYIVTGRNIPVKYCTGPDNMTDGKTVYLSSKLDGDRFDCAVGTALHESAHCKLSDFEFLKLMMESIDLFLDLAFIQRAAACGIGQKKLISIIQLLLNVIEDRRIDHWMYRTAPGYRPYYLAMYDKFWHSAEIDDMLKSQLYRTVNVESYLTRIINISNRNFDVTALPDLDKIYNLVDLRNIERLNDEKFWNERTPKFITVSEHDNMIGADIHKYRHDISETPKVFQLVIQITSIILDNLEKGDVVESSSNENGSGGDGSGGAGGEELDGDGEITLDLADDDDDDENEVEDEPEENNSTKNDSKSKDDSSHIEKDISGNVTIKISKKNLKKALENQMNFINGKTHKVKISERLAKEINIIDQSRAKIVEVGHSVFKTTRCKCVVIKKINYEILENGTLGIANKYQDKLISTPEMEEAISDGIRKGNILANRLSIRNDSRTLKSTRQVSGRVERRLLAGLGAGIETIFSSTRVEKFKPINIHLTIDASSSMAGRKWLKSITTAAAICKAAELINNIDVTVSVRASKDNLAEIIFIYDSRTDTSLKIKSLWKYLTPYGCTPEGLTFEAIKSTLIETADNSKEMYFINFSDGAPFYHFNSSGKAADHWSGQAEYSYMGDSAAIHTRAQVNELKEAGFRIMSYFISESGSPTSDKSLFTKMYGKDAEFIDVTNIIGLITTLNKLFLQK